jgi:uncharacterized protein DUF955
MPPPAWQKAATLQAERLIDELGIDSLPVMPLTVAQELDIRVEALPARRTTGVSGMLLRNGNNFGIMYSTSVDSAGFQHFSISHELGHYRLPGHPESVLQDGMHASYAGFASKDQFELEADHFAAGLLMPRTLFDRALRQASAGMDGIIDISGQCITSLPATAIRTAQRTPDALAIVVSCGNTVDYCFMSDTLKELRGLTWINKGTPLPLSSATREFNQDADKVRRSERADGNGNLKDWFGGRLESDLYEEVIGLGSYGRTLSVLTIEDLPDEEEAEEDEDLIESWTPRFRR